MSLQVEKLEKNMAKLTVETSAEELENALQKAYLKNRGSIALPGFRKGKAPRKVVEKMYGAGVFYEDAANILIPEAYAKEVEGSELDLVSQPEIDVVQIEAGKPFIFTAEVALKPEVTLGEYKGVEVPKQVIEVTEEEIQAEVDKERENNSRIINVDDRAAAQGDIVVLDYEGFAEGVAFEGGKGENHELTIGSGSFIPGFEEALIGSKIDEDVDVNVIFPEEYQEEKLAGKPAVFKCKVHEIKVKELPEADDDFAKDVSEFDTLDEYMDNIKKDLTEKKEKEAKKAKETAAIEKAVENAEMEVPDPMVAEQVKQMAEDFSRRIQSQGLTIEQYFQFTGMTAEKFMEQMKPEALKRIQNSLVLEAVAKAEDIQASDEKLEEEIVKMAQTYKMEVDKLKELMGDNEINQLKQDLAIQEAVALISEAAVEV